MSISKLPWSVDEYTKLEPNELLPEPAPTPEQRIRVVAALVTQMRDRNMLGAPSTPNSETIRGLLVMSATEWAHAMRALPAGMLVAYDPVDPSVRFDQVVRFANSFATGGSGEEDKCKTTN